MLTHLRERVAAALATERAVTVSSIGPAGLQALYAPCWADGLRLLLYVPSTVDLLANLKGESAVVITSPHWQLWGQARVLKGSLRLPVPPIRDAAWYAAIEVRPRRIGIAQPTGWGAAETIDIDEAL